MEKSSIKSSIVRALTGVLDVATPRVVANASAGRCEASRPDGILADQCEIAALLVRWGYARDSDDWEILDQCFHDGARIHISWISATAKEFVARSKDMAAARKPGSHLKHVISPPWIRVNKNKAFTRTHAALYIREEIDGQGVDITCHVRFFDLLERRENGWRIVNRVAVYEKDRLDPVDPRGFPAGFFAGMDLTPFPPTAKFLCYWLARIGRPSSSENIISVYSEGERELVRVGEQWIA